MKIKLAGILLGAALISTCSFASSVKEVETTVHTQKHVKKHTQKQNKKHVKKHTQKHAKKHSVAM